MNFQSLLLIIISSMLVIVSAWTVNIFFRLGKASKLYKTDEMFDSACHMSNQYTSIGITISISMLLISVLVLIVSSITIYNNFN